MSQTISKLLDRAECIARPRRVSSRVGARTNAAFREPLADEIDVLLVEDDPLAAQAIARLLKMHRARAIHVDSVQTARRRLDERSPLAAVLADMTLGGNPTAGAEVLEHALAVRPNLHAMAMTAMARTREIENRIARLQIVFTSKPLDGLVLSAFVRKARAARTSARSRRIVMIDAVGARCGLTDAECETLFHLSLGLVAKEIAIAMHLEESTVRGYLEELRRKLGPVHSVNEIFGRLITELL